MTQEQIENLIAENNSLKTQIDRLSELINMYSAERDKAREIREYIFSPLSLTSEEQTIIGKFICTPLVELLTKWFKSRADQNNDMFIHNADASDEKKALWRTAVLIYEDWYMFMKNCGQLWEKSENKTK